ncbi:anti-phage dCTP deaminase [Sphingomonas sp. LR60]|uniref:anti-phage dCTP deaminase n=1 Tax=Sphingomonas sp. LR60 TaxID=3050233 RepID=UPI002FE005A0
MTGVGEVADKRTENAKLEGSSLGQQAPTKHGPILKKVGRERSKPEIVIGLVGPVGTDLHALATLIEEKMAAFKYRCEKVRVSALIRSMCDEKLSEHLNNIKGGERTRLLMNAGDFLRGQSDKGDALVPLIVAAIRAARVEFNKEDGVTEDIHAENACYIVDSLKHPDEISTLRRLYGSGFILVSAFDAVDSRTSKLQRDIAKENVSTDLERYRKEAVNLINIDSKRPGGGIGQNVRDSFPLGDFFVRVAGDYEIKVGRFIDLLFGSPYLTPYRYEYFMFEASAASLRSVDLSRQIGAVIVSPQNEIVSSGCNDVPMAGGGTYWPDDPASLDNRDFKTGQDFNSVKKFDIINEMLKFLEDNNLYKRTSEDDPAEITRQLVTGKFKSTFKELRISNLIEFGRVVHAEMFALMRAAQRGISVDNSTIFSTTFPCHMCARHIIASGITKVIYIEPYPKSMTSELFPESVMIDHKDFATDDSGKRLEGMPTAITTVRFEPYEGVAPRLYGPLFRAPDSRKDSQGYTVNWQRAFAKPKIFELPDSNLQVERRIALGLDSLPKVGLEACLPSQGEQDNAG